MLEIARSLSTLLRKNLRNRRHLRILQCSLNLIQEIDLIMRSQTKTAPLYEVTVAYGMEQIGYQELQMRLSKRIRLRRNPDDEQRSGALQFSYRGNVRRILNLNTILNAFLVCEFDVPRPKSLLTDANISNLIDHIKSVLRLSPQSSYQNFGISAAGSDSDVMLRLRKQLAHKLKLPYASEDIDLLLRIRPSRLRATGWEVLIRLTPRPLSVRAWRVSDMKGALNAAVAHGMILLTRPQPNDKFLNLACGSGTLLVERLIAAPARRVIGCDINPEAIEHARRNLAASGLQNVAELYNWDAQSLNLPDSSVDAICADLPFGIAVGSHRDNVDRYPNLLAEAARVAKPKCRFVLITQEIDLIKGLIQGSPAWQQLNEFRIDLRGLTPCIVVLERRSSRH